jgi:hypothetical protein
VRRVAATVAAAALAAAPTAAAHELTVSQKRVFEKRLHKSRTVVDWWNGRGRWALFTRADHCWQVRVSPRHRRICFAARASLAAHRARVVRLERLLIPPRPPRPVYTSPQAAICAVFGSYCQQALAVARCESGFSTTARNGQYVGLFQMGSSERATYGDAWDAYGHARAAFRYFAATGYSWGPWECRP